MESKLKRIAVIGGGFAGVASIVCLKEAGLEPVCFEQTDKPGGTWYYKEESVIGCASIMPTTIINHSKELGAISNYPPPKECNNYMRHHEMYKYFLKYAFEKDTLRHIHYNSQVSSVKKAKDYADTGRWTVAVKDTLTGKVTSDTYDGVVLCVGHINRPKMPTYPNQTAFKGKIMHTHSLKRVEEFRDKNVVVVGMGCSGVDAAVETSNVAKQVYLSTRSGAHVITRVSQNGLPFDSVLLRRYCTICLQILPTDLASWLIETLLLDPVFDHRLYTVQPKRHIMSKDPVFSDHFNSKLITGSVIQKKAIERFTENGVVFEDDSEKTETDVVIMATGYTWKFPFLEDGVIFQEDGMFNLYKCMFPYHLQHATLAAIGFILPWGPGFPVGEMQCRWAAHVLSGQGKMPSKDIMIKDIRDRHLMNQRRYEPCEKMSLRVDIVPYMDDVASQFGVKPNFSKIFFTDIRLFRKLIFGPFLSYQYRLQGPHKWEGAREAIMTCEDRILWPLKKSEDAVSRDGILMRMFKRVLKIIFQYSI